VQTGSPSNAAAGPGQCDWVVTPGDFGFDVYASPIFFLGVVDGHTHFMSHYFNITQNTTSPLSSAKPSLLTTTSTPPSTSTAAPSTSSTLVSTAKIIGSSTSVPTKDISAATKVGLGLGLGVGIPLILLSGILLGMKIAQRRRDPYTTVPISHEQKISEMADNREPVEMYVGGLAGIAGTNDLPNRSSTPRDGLVSPTGA
jgi:hypothetical protein